MIVKHFESKEDWLKDREGKIGGSSSFDVYSIKEATVDEIKSALDADGIEYKKSASKGELISLLKKTIEPKISKKMGYYQLMAERIAIKEDAPEEEDSKDRGTRLELEAVQKCAEALGATVTNDEIVWISDLHDAMRYSPDGVVSDEEVIEAKCLDSATHLYIYFEKDIPEKYMRQNIQAFVVNEKLKKLHFACYDPRIPSLPLHYITFTREQLAQEIEAHKNYQLQVLKMLEDDIIKLTF